MDKHGQDDCIKSDPLREFVDIVRALRGPNGCPWDKQQSHRSLRPYVIEEACEVAEAIDSGDPGKLREELGDLLLQVVLHAVIAEESGTFDLDDIARDISAKMIRRHPHVFSDVAVSGADEVLRNWEAIKRAERGDAEPQSALAGVPADLPALMRAQKIQAKAARVGFDWPKVEEAMAKIPEELAELTAAYRGGERDTIEEEIGDLLFAVVNVARFLEVDPEGALARTTRKFSARFRHIEERARAAGVRLEDMSLAEMDALWEEAKRKQDPTPTAHSPQCSEEGSE